MCLETRLGTETGEGIQHLESTCWASSHSSSPLRKLWFWSSPFPYHDYFGIHPLLGVSWHILTSMYWDSLPFTYITFLLCFFPTMPPVRFWTKEPHWSWITASFLASSPVPCTSAFHISRDTSCELAFVIFVLQMSQPPLIPVTFHWNFQLFKGLAENNVWIKIALVRGALNCWCDTVSWWKWYLQSSVLNNLPGPLHFYLRTVLNWQQFVIFLCVVSFNVFSWTFFL